MFRNNGMHVQEYIYDFATDGGLVSTINLAAKSGSAPLPQGAIVRAVSLKIITAIVGTSSTLAAGNVTDPDGYMVATAEATLVDDYVSGVGTGVSVLLWDDTNDHAIPFLVNSDNDANFSISIATAALTAGKALFYVEYYLPSED